MNENNNNNNPIIAFLATTAGRIFMIMILYVFFVGIIYELIEAGGNYFIIGLIITIPFGWRVLNKIQPAMFLWLNFMGWLIYFFVKGLLSCLIGAFVAPFVIGNFIASKVSEVSNESGIQYDAETGNPINFSDSKNILPVAIFAMISVIVCFCRLGVVHIITHSSKPHSNSVMSSELREQKKKDANSVSGINKELQENDEPIESDNEEDLSDNDYDETKIYDNDNADCTSQNETKQPELLIDYNEKSSTTIGRIEIKQISDKITAEGEKKTYDITAEETGTYRFELSNVPQNLWFGFCLYNEMMEQLAEGSGDNNAGITYDLEAGKKYFFAVEQSSGTGSYTLNIGTAKPITDISSFTSVTDSTQFKDQKNIYSFTSDNEGTYRFELSDVPQNIWFDFYLYNDSMEQLAESSGDNYAGITYDLSSNTKYYYVVKQSSNTGSYTLNIGKAKALTDISNYNSLKDSVEFTDQKNIYKFTPKSSRTYRFQLSNVTTDCWLDFTLYNSYMEQLDSGSGENGDGITYDLEAGLDYYFVVEQETNIGSYNLDYNIYYGE